MSFSSLAPLDPVQCDPSRVEKKQLSSLDLIGKRPDFDISVQGKPGKANRRSESLGDKRRHVRDIRNC